MNKRPLPLPPEPPDQSLQKKPRPITPPPSFTLPLRHQNMTLPPIRSQHEPSTSPSAQSGSALKSLGKFARQHVKLLRQLGWHQFVKCLQIPFDTTDDLASIPHPAAPYLRTLATHGVPAPSHSPPWTKQQLQTVLNRGAHVSAKRLYREFLFEDILDMVQKGYWTVLPFSAVQHLTHLKLSLAGVVPQ